MIHYSAIKYIPNRGHQKLTPIFVSPHHFPTLQNTTPPFQLFSYVRRLNKIQNYACGILKDMDDAEEVVQSIFLKLWEQREGIEINVSLKSYLYRKHAHYPVG